MRQRRTAILVAPLAGLLAVVAVQSYCRMASRRRSALAARDNLAACRRMSSEIERFSRRRAVAEERERRSAEVIGPIEQAARAAGIPGDRLVRITPVPPRRIDDSAYKEKPTQTILKRVTLEALVRMLHRLAQADQPLHPAAVRLSAPSREDTGPLWNAEILLSYLIYEPVRPPE